VYTIGWFVALCFVGSAVQYGYVIGAPFYFLYQLVFKAHIAEFLFGVTLGWLFIQTPRPSITWINRFGATIAGVILALLFSTCDIKDKHVGFLFTYSANGLLVPLHGLLIWSLANGEDILLSGILSSDTMRYLGNISFHIYILQAFVHELCRRMGYPAFFLPGLLALSALMYTYFEEPLADLAHLALKIFTSSTSRFSIPSMATRLANQLERSPLPKVAVLGLYYTLMFGGIVAFSVAMIFKLEGGSHVATLKKESASAFDNLKWVVLLGMPAVLCTLLVSMV
jgi:peptidoglycan/LPS O-acetylase OafA/YrhL